MSIESNPTSSLETNMTNNLNDLMGAMALTDVDLKDFKCSLCPKVYKKYGHLANHLKEKQAIQKESFNCDECHKTFDTVKKLTRHKKSHN